MFSHNFLCATRLDRTVARHGERRRRFIDGSSGGVVGSGGGEAPQVQRDVRDGGDHGTHEGGGAEEEGPTVAVGECLVSARCLRLLTVGHLVVDGRDVDDDTEGKAESCNGKTG